VTSRRSWSILPIPLRSDIPLDSALSARADTRAWLGLTLVPGIPPAKQRALLDKFRTPQAIIDAPAPSVSYVAGPKIAELIAQGPQASIVDATLRWLAKPGCQLVTINDAAYPKALREIADPPAVLYVQGRVELLDRPAFAIVGSRNATPQGLRDAHAFARALSEEGLAIVSGLALGIDAAAHRGGLAAAGSSIAVMGTGPDIVYPRRNLELAHALAAQGCLASEFPVGMPSLAGNFPRRNRLISGLARGVLVVEAALRSGSLTTARFALEQNREVFAIPGSIHSPLAKGCHWLIKEGAKLVESADDILAELGIAVARAGAAGAQTQVEETDPVLDAMGFAPASIDQLAQRTGLDAATLAAQLVRLEIEAGVVALPGGWFQRIDKRVIE
jgi:DNA processing protein